MPLHLSAIRWTPLSHLKLMLNWYHILLIKCPFVCISSTAAFSPHNDCLFASCLQNPLTRYVELNQGALANIFQMSLPEAWLLVRGAEHQNFLETWRIICCAQHFVAKHRFKHLSPGTQYFCVGVRD